MANLTVTAPDGYIPRIRAAFGKYGQPASLAEIQDELEAYIRARVIKHETLKAAEDKRGVIEKETW